MSVCVRVRVCVCARVCVCVCVRARRAPSFGRSKRSNTHTINGIFVSLFNFVSLFMFLLYLMYIKHKKMPAHCCIYKLMFYIYLMKYLFNISEYKAMLIKLLIYHINIYFIHICVCMYVCIYVCIYIYINNKKYR